jgi:hypothetical protein
MVMSNSASSSNFFWGPLKLIGKYIALIFRYLACHENETPGSRNSLRDLYNSGRIDEIKYHQCREQCWVDNYDPEEIEKPM